MHFGAGTLRKAGKQKVFLEAKAAVFGGRELQGVFRAGFLLGLKRSGSAAVFLGTDAYLKVPKVAKVRTIR